MSDVLTFSMTEVVFLCVLYLLKLYMDWCVLFRSKITGCVSAIVHSRSVDHWIL